MAKIKPTQRGQQQLFDPSTSATMRQFAPVEHLRSAAAQYAKSIGQKWDDTGLDNVRVDPERGHATFLAYRNQMNNPSGSETPGLRDSYAAMAEHVNRQYDFVTRPKEQGGLGIKHEVVDGDPYPDPPAMAQDLQGGRIKTFATASTGKHEFFDDETNDKFRAVHDVFGHAAIGRGFSRDGEEAGFRSHAQMFPPEAHAALATETRGQNSYLNYGPGGFASQDGRLVGLPKWAGEIGALPTPATPQRPTPLQPRLFG